MLKEDREAGRCALRWIYRKETTLKKQIPLMQFVFLDTVCVVVFLGDVSIYETSEV